jgi:hypothetical protein
MAEHIPKTIKGAGSSIKLMKGHGGSLNLASAGLDGLRFDGFDAKVTLEELV